MSVRQLRAHAAAAVAIDVHAAVILHHAGHFADFEAAQAWLMKLGAPTVGRRVVATQRALFDAGDTANFYYLVVSGELLVHRRQRPRSKPGIRFMRRGDLLIYDCDGRHAASCHATIDSVVMPIERRWLNNVAGCNTALAGLLRSVHAAELELILGSLGAEPVGQEEQPPEVAAQLTYVQTNCIRALHLQAPGLIAATRRIAANAAAPAVIFKRQQKQEFRDERD